MQALLGESKFLESLQTFDKDNIPPSTIDRVRPYLDLKEFDPEVVKKASKAAYGLCSWVRAMEAYDRVAKVVEPKRKRLDAAQAEVVVLLSSLKEKQAQLAKVRVSGLVACMSNLPTLGARTAGSTACQQAVPR